MYGLLLDQEPLNFSLNTLAPNIINFVMNSILKKINICRIIWNPQTKVYLKIKKIVQFIRLQNHIDIKLKAKNKKKSKVKKIILQ
jgi:hypothetical protein